MSLDPVVECKTRGNIHFKAKEYTLAIEAFTEGLGHDPSNHVLYSNRSAAKASCGDYVGACADAQKTIDLKPNWPRGYSRLGTALSLLGKDDEARSVIQHGIRVDPTNAYLRKALEDLSHKQQKKNNNYTMGDVMKDPNAMEQFKNALGPIFASAARKK